MIRNCDSLLFVTYFGRVARAKPTNMASLSAKMSREILNRTNEDMNAKKEDKGSNNLNDKIQGRTVVKVCRLGLSGLKAFRDR